MCLASRPYLRARGPAVKDKPKLAEVKREDGKREREEKRKEPRPREERAEEPRPEPRPLSF
jgi:hypothetical protein